MPPPSVASPLKSEGGVFYCEKFDLSKCKTDNSTCEPTTVQCEHNHGIDPACFALWTNSSDKGVVVIHKGCWMSQNDIKHCSPDDCVTNRPQTNKNMITYFCCCEKSNCNEDIYYNSTSNLHLSDKDSVTCIIPVQNKVDLLNGCLFVLGPIFALVLIIFVIYTVYRKLKFKQAQGSTSSPASNTNWVKFSSKSQCSPLIPSEPLDMVDVIARGRFGCVWKARRGDDVVAVKIFPPQAMESWVQEQDIYSVEALGSSENILKFISAEERGSGLNLQYYLITEYHSNGSLYDYLKGHTLNIIEFLHMSTSMLQGLAFLHEEVIKNDKIYKPAIVHRDFKSRNVLLKTDLTAVIADFGLALKCEHGRTPKDTHNQVGTHRYMAPEVLESATEFSAFAFKQIDVYASALVLWELLSRCKVDDESPHDYKLPYEEEVGSKPSLMDMQELVVKKKKRPVLKTSWISNTFIRTVCKTVEEMWDMEPEARITSGCALERLMCLKSSVLNNMASECTADGARDTTPLIHLAGTLNVL